MSRAWPFEDVEDHGPIRTPDQFVEHMGEGAEAVVIRIGLHDAQVVLVDRAGRWQRWVYHSVEEATEVAERLGVPVHVGEYPEEMRVRINSFQRPSNDFDKGAYPEQGAVGPVIPYPENRPRRPDVAKKERSESAD
ncbi:MAG TPA: hypothetical protein VJ927_07165 [Actinomycetota bacterium]|nr:hypothetical protein [Actinomycetota bacterium]